MKLETKISGAEIDASTIESLSGSVEIGAKSKSAKVDKIDGKVSVKSRLKDGLLNISISPHFDWGVSLMNLEAIDTVDDEITKRLLAAGFDQSQIDKIASVFEQETFDFESAGSELSSSDGLMDPIVKTSSIAASGIPFPSVDLNLDSVVDVKEMNVGSVNVSAKSDFSASNLTNTSSPVSEFLCITEVKGDKKFSSIEVNDASLDQLLIPQISTPGFKAGVELSEVNVSSVPLEFSASNVESKFRLHVLDKRPRWREKVCIKVWRWKKCAWIEFGVNINITIDYTWAISLMNVAVNIKNICIKEISASVAATNINVKNVVLGRIKSKQIVSKVQ